MDKITEKAIRLIKNGQVWFKRHQNGWNEYEVSGDHGRYTVRIGKNMKYCECDWKTHRPNGKPCSHIEAGMIANKNRKGKMKLC